MNLYNRLKLIIMAMCMCVLAVACGVKENNEYENLTIYYGIMNIGGYSGASIILDGNMDGAGFECDGEYYIPYEIMRKNIDNHFYMDMEEKILTYATSKNVYDAVAGVKSYKMDGEESALAYAPVIVANEDVYVSVSYAITLNKSLRIESFAEPNRIVVKTLDKDETVTVKEDTKIRSGVGVTNTIVADVKKGDILSVTSSEDKWSYVCSKDGIVGYIDNSKIDSAKEETVDLTASWLKNSPYTYVSSSDKICLVWHQMEYDSGNDRVSAAIAKADPVNVISPTWFKLVDNYGGISSLASKEYVNKAHNKNMQVWGLISDFNRDEDGSYYVNKVLNVTSTRRTLIKNIIDEASKCGMDGINIDFEKIRYTSGESYIQFMRELAIECDNNNLVLSVDMYVPTEDNAYYGRDSVGEVVDYLIIMGYDEHWGGCNQPGSVASLPFVKNGIEDTVALVDSSRVINAVPFYTRAWYEEPVENAPEDAVIIEDAVNGDYALSSKALDMDSAKELLEQNGAPLMWLDDLGQYYGEYSKDGRLVRIWLEDRESLSLKLATMKENNLAGVACWKLGLESKDAWEILEEYKR